jgi:hypothetical protein
LVEVDDCTVGRLEARVARSKQFSSEARFSDGSIFHDGPHAIPRWVCWGIKGVGVSRPVRGKGEHGHLLFKRQV